VRISQKMISSGRPRVGSVAPPVLGAFAIVAGGGGGFDLRNKMSFFFSFEQFFSEGILL
jgi:hypothetical protein